MQWLLTVPKLDRQANLEPQPAPGEQSEASGGDRAGGRTRPDGSPVGVTPPDPELVKAGVIVSDALSGGDRERVLQSTGPENLSARTVLPASHRISLVMASCVWSRGMSALAA
jgi:hypothetical protein